MQASPPPAKATSAARRRWSAAAGILPLLLLLAGCDLEFDAQEIHARYDPQTDVLEVLLIAKGLHPGDPDDEERMPKAVAALRRLLAGERTFMIVDWPLYWPLDEWRDEAREKLQTLDARAASPEEDDDHERRVTELQLALYEHFSLQSQGLFLHEGELCGYQSLSLRDVQGAVRTGNALLHAALLEDAPAPGAAEDQEDGLDAESIELMLARARAGEPFFQLDEAGLRVDVPLSAEQGRELRRKAVRGLLDLELEEKDAPFIHLMAEFSTMVRQLEFGAESASFTLGGPDPRRIDLSIDIPEPEGSAALLAEVRRQGIAVDPQLTLESLRARIED